MHFDPIDVGSWRDRLKLSKCHRQSTSEYNFPTFLVTSGRHSYDLSNNFSWNTLVVFQLTAKLITTIKIPIIKGNWKCWIRWWGNWCHWWQMMMCTHMKTICRGGGASIWTELILCRGKSVTDSPDTQSSVSPLLTLLPVRPFCEHFLPLSLSTQQVCVSSCRSKGFFSQKSQHD